MKPKPERNFPISVRHEVWEAPSDTSALYEGIYSLILNHGTIVTFVPHIDRPPADAAISLPAEFDTISTPMEARLVSLAVAEYAVTADDQRAGSEGAAAWIDWGEDEPHPVPIVFYVTEREFAVYQRELSELSELFSGIHDTVPVSAVDDKKVVQFVLGRVLPSI